MVRDVLDLVSPRISKENSRHLPNHRYPPVGYRLGGFRLQGEIMLPSLSTHLVVDGATLFDDVADASSCHCTASPARYGPDVFDHHGIVVELRCALKRDRCSLGH